MTDPREPALSAPALGRRNRAVAGVLAGVVAAMVGLAYASVPLYRLFCQITGYGGTPRIDAARVISPAAADAPEVVVRFDANIAPDLPWRFQPEAMAVRVRVGEQALAFYRARNLSDQPSTGNATFNVTPLKAGPYFVKIDCFCFREQTLQPGQEVDMPVTFVVEPALSTDIDTSDVREITLSYTFFRSTQPVRPSAAARPTLVPESAAPDHS